MFQPDCLQSLICGVDKNQGLDQRLLDIDKAAIRTFFHQMHRVEITDRGTIQCLFQWFDTIVEDADCVPTRDQTNFRANIQIVQVL